ncbi:hypothetical protein MSKU15_0706 [Komagataeibacter diospyri]|nr:hypothetical protein MSKU15_0706 [Komagataeibacter diospyri]
MNANRIIATKGLSHRVAMSLNEGCRLKIFCQILFHNHTDGVNFRNQRITGPSNSFPAAFFYKHP